MPQAYNKWELSYTQNRELSWLKFNARVLEEAVDSSVPLMERLRFVSIFTSNLDEFFMVRVGSLHDLSVMTPEALDNKSGLTPKEQLDRIYDAVRPLIRQRDAIYAEVSSQLSKFGICRLSYDKLKDKEKNFVRKYYKEQIRPLISPQIIDRSHPFPHLKNKKLYAAALLQSGEQQFLGIVDVPESVPSIIHMPDNPDRFIGTEEILIHYLKNIFKIYSIVEQSVISVTRNADISFNDEKFEEDGDPDLLSHMVKLLKRRDRLNPVRLEVQGDAPLLSEILTHFLKLQPHQVYSSTCPLNMGFAYSIAPENPALYYPPYTPSYPRYLTQEMPMWDQIQQRDILLFYPYHSMQPFLNLLRESAHDPRVVSIQITIYRLARNSSVAKYLQAAAENGKSVTVLVELRARFDEENNIEWAQELEEAGCKIIYGSDLYKCHSKICLITRRDKNGRLSHVTQIGTGNYNEKTAALYTDFCLMTADKAIADDAVNFFQNMLMGSFRELYKTLLVAPACMKSELIRMIDGEIAKGSQGRIIIKVNSVTERDLIDKLSEASQAGVKIDLIVRGICCIIPGIPGKTDNITVTSIVGRFLEHARVYAFGTGATRLIYISSADIMTRNQTRRVEIACPIKSPEIGQWLADYLDIQLRDNLKARKLLPSGEYTSVKGGPPVSSQQYFLDNPPEFTHTVVKKDSIITRILKLFRKR